MVDLPDYNDLLWMGLKNYIQERKDKRAIYEEDENCIRLLSLLCEEMKHYGRKLGEVKPNIKIEARNDKSEIKMIYSGPTHPNTINALIDFDQKLKDGIEKLENGEEYKDRIRIKVEK